MTLRPPDDLAELMREVRRVEIRGRRLVSEFLAGSWRSVFHGTGLAFHEVREYVEGDDPRAVDWNVTARMGRPFVKTFVEDRARSVLFVLDVSASMDGGWGPLSCRAVAARVMACLGLAAASSQDRVGLVACGRDVQAWVAPHKGRRHVLRILRDGLSLPAAPGPGDLSPGLAFAHRIARDGAIVFVLSDFLQSGWRPALSRLARHHDAIAVRLLPPELDPAGDGLLRLVDPATGTRRLVDLGDARVRDAWRRRVAAWRRRTEDDVARAGAERVDLPVPAAQRPDRDGVARPLLRFFRMRELAERRR